jgi:D-3-phosphoglycerate dehydrogenase
MNKILITTSSFGKEDPSATKLLQDAGYEVILNPHGRKLSEDEVLNLLLEVKPVGMIAGVEPLTARVLEQAKDLKVISRCGIGLDNVDLNATRDRGIIVLNAPDGPTQAVAELTVGLMLAGLRHIVETDTAIHSGQWKRPMGRLLAEQTVGIVGCGRIGSAVAELVKPFGTKLLGYDPNISRHQVIHLVRLDELLEEADIVSLHLPYGKSTHHLVDKQLLGKMKKGALVVNTSRGGVVDEQGLYEAIVSGHLGGACIDTFEEEPYTGPLTNLPQVVLTAHIGSYAKEARTKMERQAILNLLSAMKG